MVHNSVKQSANSYISQASNMYNSNTVFLVSKLDMMDTGHKLNKKAHYIYIIYIYILRTN